MPKSFYIFLFVSFVALIPAFFDHGETWELLKFEKEKRCRHLLKLLALWIIPFSTIIGTIYLGFESKDAAMQERQHEVEYAGVTNQLYDATNDLAFAHRQIFGLSNQLTATAAQINIQSNALSAAKIKPIKQRIIDCLNSINPKIILSLKDGNTRFNAMIEQYRRSELEELSRDQEGAKYIHFLKNSGGSAEMTDGNTYRDTDFDLNPALLQP